MPSETSLATPLRRALGANALFSALSAILLVSRANWMAGHLVLSTQELVGLGTQLGVFAAFLLWLATRPRLGRRWVLVLVGLVVLADAGWVAGSLLGLATGIAWTPTGAALVITGLAGTGSLAAAQMVALIRVWGGESVEVTAPVPLAQRVRRVTSLAGLVAALFALLYVSLPLADLRAPAVRAPGAAERAAYEGRKLLEAVALAHGLEALEERRTMEIVAVDEWTGSSAWWAEPSQRFRAERLIGTFTSRVELLDGPEAGQIRGIQSWTPYRQATAGAPLELPDEDPMITFYLPTLQYFDELPFRLLEASVALDAGLAEVGGRRFRRLFVSWGQAGPQTDVDQYDLLVDPATLLIAKVAYTVRDGVSTSPFWMRPLMRFAAVGTMHYEDYRDVAGVMMPYRQTVTLGTAEAAPRGLEETYFHRLLVESVRFDSIDATTLLPIEGLPDPGDRKPS